MTFMSEKVAKIPPHIFVEIRKKKEAMIAEGVDVIDLGIGDPDLPTPQHIVEKMKEEMNDPANFKYPNFSGSLEYRQAVADFYKRQYDVDLDPETEVLALVGSKEGIFNVVHSVINPGDYVLIPEPGYAMYQRAAILANGQYYYMALRAENAFLPDFNDIPVDIINQSKLMFLNYPNNPTSATVDLDFYNNAMEYAHKNQLVMATDTAYNLVTFDGYKAPSLLQAEGAKERAVEFGSLSKTYCMTGWRIGYAVGNKDIIRSLAVYKSNVDSGQFTLIQKAAAFALNSDQSCIEEYNLIYKERLEAMAKGLQTLGIKAEVPKGGFFIWAPVPERYTSTEFFERVLEQTGVIFTPGNAFGPSGEGYFRISMSVPNERIFEAIERIKQNLSI